MIEIAGGVLLSAIYIYVWIVFVLRPSRKRSFKDDLIAYTCTFIWVLGCIKFPILWVPTIIVIPVYVVKVWLPREKAKGNIWWARGKNH